MRLCSSTPPKTRCPGSQLERPGIASRCSLVAAGSWAAVVEWVAQAAQAAATARSVAVGVAASTVGSPVAAVEKEVAVGG